jgi:uncharacterized protein YjbI with pentapeptide repeats
MANPEHVERLWRQDVLAWNKWRVENPDIEPDLIGANLEKIDLRAVETEKGLASINLGRAHLQGAILSRAHLENALLYKAHLEGANLRYAHLEGASLWVAYLEGANLLHAHLEGAKLNYAHINWANLEMADVREANMRDTDLENTRVTGIKFQKETLQGFAIKIQDKHRQVLPTVFWGEPKFQGIRVSTCYGSQQFKTFA